jgi:hypothetical protein
MKTKDDKLVKAVSEVEVGVGLDFRLGATGRTRHTDVAPSRAHTFPYRHGLLERIFSGSVRLVVWIVYLGVGSSMCHEPLTG